MHRLYASELYTAARPSAKFGAIAPAVV